MSQTDFSRIGTRTPADRTVMHVLYGMHCLAPFTAWTLAVVALIVNYIKRPDELDPLYAGHHSYMISTFWWSLALLIPASIVTVLLIVTILLAWLFWLPFALVSVWYLYRCFRGWLRFVDNRLPNGEFPGSAR